MKTVLVVGSAGKLGSHLAKSLISNSNIVVGIDKTPPSSSVEGFGYTHYQADVSKEGELHDVLRSMHTTEITLSGIVNCFFHPEITENADADLSGNRIEQLDAAFRKYSDVSFATELSGNLAAVHNVIRTFLPNDFDVDFSVVNVSSVLGLRQPNPTYLEFPNKFRFKPPGYSVSKSGLIAYTEYLANLYAGTKFRFNTIAPGFIDSGQSEEFKSRFNDRLSIRRFATLEEIAAPIEFLLSKSSSYLTGSTLVVDGGYIGT